MQDMSAVPMPVDWKYAPSPAQSIYHAREDLHPGQQALMAVLEDLSRRDGAAEVSLQYLADHLRCSKRWVQKMLNGYSYSRYKGKKPTSSHDVPGLVTRGLVNVLHRRRFASVYRIATPEIEAPEAGASGGEPVDNLLRIGPVRVNARSPLDGGRVHPPGGERAFTHINTVIKSLGAPPDVSPPTLFEPQWFNPDTILWRGDWMKPEVRTLTAWKRGKWTHVMSRGTNGQVAWKVVACELRDTSLRMRLKRDGELDKALIVTLRDLYTAQFFRLRHANRKRRCR